MSKILSTTARNVLSRERMERAVRVYNSTRHAAEALGVHQESIARACRRYGLSFGYVGTNQRGPKTTVDV